MKRQILLLLTLISLCFAFGIQVNADIAVSDWQNKAKFPADISIPGNPNLPYYPVKIILPFGEDVANINVSLSGETLLRSSLSLDYVRAQQPTSQAMPDMTIRNEAVYCRDAAYPETDFLYLGTQYYRGYQIAVINIYPFRYNPVQKRLIAYSNAVIDVETTPSLQTADYQRTFYTYDSRASQDLALWTLNPEAANTYSVISKPAHHPQSRLIDLSTPKKMIVITDAVRAPWFTEYVAWREQHGVSTGVFLTSDIYASYQGIDNAQKVRNFIIDAYQTWSGTSTPLEYVLLGGDDEIVPERGCYGEVGDTVDARIPTDLYYGCLDGTWNSNNNDIWGQPADNVDMIPEVHVGRFPAETLGEFNNIFRKIRYYTDINSFSNNLAVMFGENLNMNPVTWGGDYKDDVLPFVPDTYQVETHYQRDGTYSESIVWNTINNGANVMNHMGHANETFLLGQGNGTIEQLQNTEYGWLYSQGCYPAAFDQRTSGDGESIGEHLLTASGALMSFIGNTRYGWYMPGSIDGASEFFDRQYFNGMYNNVIPEFGKALSYCRTANLNAALQNSVMRWCYYEHVLFGDPSVQVKYPDAMMPLLSLDGYTIDDVEGDNDGIINPGEIIRIHPRIKNAAGWHTAYNVTVQASGLPQGAQILGSCPSYPQIAPGQVTGEDSYIRLQLPDSMGFGIYTLKLSLQSFHPQTNLTTGIRVFTVSFESTLLDNRFPWDCQTGSKTAPIVYDFNGDDQLEISYLSSFGTTYYIGNDGEDYQTYGAPDENIMRNSAMGDVDGDGSPEIVFVSRTGRIICNRLNGTNLFSYQTPTSFVFSPVLADIDADGLYEVIAGGMDHKLYALEGTGSLCPGFPVDLGSAFNSELAAADLFSDGAMEIIAGTNGGYLYAVGSGGGTVESFPVNLGSPITGSPTVLETSLIVVGTATDVYVVNPFGSVLFSKPIPSSMAGGASLADINRNGSVDIVFVTLNGMLYALDQTGNDLPGFPVNVGVNFNCPPLIADMDNDQQHEILLHSYVNSVYIYNNDGSPLPGFPFITSYNGATPASLVDFDDSGIFKLVTGYSTGVLLINLRRPASDMTPWTTYRGNLNRQGSYAATGYVANQDEENTPLVQSLSQNSPNPFSSITNISYTTKSSGTARLEIYNLRGQLVKTLVSETKSAGNHTASWDGLDASGRAVSAGIYLYRLSTKDGSSTRKMLIVK